MQQGPSCILWDNCDAILEQMGLNETRRQMIIERILRCSRLCRSFLPSSDLLKIVKEWNRTNFDSCTLDPIVVNFQQPRIVKEITNICMERVQLIDFRCNQIESIEALSSVFVNDLKSILLCNNKLKKVPIE